MSSFCWTCCSCHVFIPNPSHPQRVLSPVWGTAGCQLEGCRGPTAHGGWGLATRVAWQIGVTMDILNDIMIYYMLDILDIFIYTYILLSYTYIYIYICIHRCNMVCIYIININYQLNLYHIQFVMLLSMDVQHFKGRKDDLKCYSNIQQYTLNAYFWLPQRTHTHIVLRQSPHFADCPVAGAALRLRVWAAASYHHGWSPSVAFATEAPELPFSPELRLAKRPG